MVAAASFPASQHSLLEASAPWDALLILPAKHAVDAGDEVVLSRGHREGIKSNVLPLSAEDTSLRSTSGSKQLLERQLLDDLTFF